MLARSLVSPSCIIASLQVTIRQMLLDEPAGVSKKFRLLARVPMCAHDACRPLLQLLQLLHLAPAASRVTDPPPPPISCQRPMHPHPATPQLAADPATSLPPSPGAGCGQPTCASL